MGLKYHKAPSIRLPALLFAAWELYGGELSQQGSADSAVG